MEEADTGLGARCLLASQGRASAILTQPLALGATAWLCPGAEGHGARSGHSTAPPALALGARGMTGSFALPSLKNTSGRNARQCFFLFSFPKSKAVRPRWDQMHTGRRQN